ncbi:hypothetical protein BJX68DRAFT_4602 [Aspergillus pseudodeflectus]|uniref:Uncharacterized protein n=1 Tax=Aspergillus pseudodeflectus TaxID=176178 RepID=A0ABR4LA72_9EURO
MHLLGMSFEMKLCALGAVKSPLLRIVPAKWSKNLLIVRISPQISKVDQSPYPHLEQRAKRFDLNINKRLKIEGTVISRYRNRGIMRGKCILNFIFYHHGKRNEIFNRSARLVSSIAAPSLRGSQQTEDSLFTPNEEAPRAVLFSFLTKKRVR